MERINILKKTEVALGSRIEIARVYLTLSKAYGRTRFCRKLQMSALKFILCIFL